MISDQLELNDFTLKLANANTDLQISLDVVIDNSSEFIITGDADLTMLSTLKISAGGVKSTAGTLSFQGGTTDWNRYRRFYRKYLGNW